MKHEPKYTAFKNSIYKIGSIPISELTFIKHKIRFI
jgi:hypothetical protein